MIDFLSSHILVHRFAVKRSVFWIHNTEFSI